MNYARVFTSELLQYFLSSVLSLWQIRDIYIYSHSDFFNSN